jgi:hypothetical protein
VKLAFSPLTRCPAGTADFSVRLTGHRCSGRCVRGIARPTRPCGRGGWCCGLCVRTSARTGCIGTGR